MGLATEKDVVVSTTNRNFLVEWGILKHRFI